MTRFKIFGYALISFIIILVILISNSYSGLPNDLYRITEIDSVIVIKNGKTLLIRNQDTIQSISKILRNSKKFKNIDRISINKDSYRIVFYARKSENTFEISILSNVYHGKIAAYYSSYFEGDSIDLYINSLKK